MADLASLKISVDSREVKTSTKDLDNMATVAGRTNASVDKLTASNKRLADALKTSNKPMIDASRMLNSMQIELSQVGKSALQIKALEIRMAAAAAPTAELSREIRTLGAELIRAERSQMLAAKGNRAIGQTGQLARHHMLNLGFQFQDLGVQIASGQNPLVAFVQQGAQIGGIMGQAQIGIGGVIRALGSMVAAFTMAIVTNPILMSIAAAAGAVALAVNFMANDISTASGVTVTAGDVMLGAFDVVRNFLATQVTAAFAYFGTTAGEVWNTVVGYTRKAVNIIIGIVSLIPRAFVEAFKTVPTAINQLMSGNFSAALATIGGSMGKIAGDTFGRDYIGEVGIAISASAVNRANQRKAEEAGKGIGRTVASGAAAGLTDGRKEFVTALDNLMAETKKIGMSPEAIRQMEVENLAVRAAAKGYDDLAANIRKAGMARELNLYAVDIAEKLKEEAKARDELSKTHQETIKKLQDELALLPLVGIERDKAALALEKEAYAAKFGATAWLEYHAARTAKIDEESAISKDRKEAERLKQQLQGVEKLLDDLTNGAVSALKDIVVTIKTNFDTEGLKKAFAPIGKTLGDALKKSGLDLSKLGKTFGAATAGAQVGTSVDAIFKGLGVKSSKMGAQVGGAIGGAAFGPIGAIAGSILGGILGGMLKKTKTGSATISQIAGQGMQTALSGNSAALKEVSNKMATGLLKGLASMAEQLGGTLGGNVNVSIGMRKKDYVVDPTGAGRTKGSGVKNFGADEAAAIAYVTQLAIQQGIVTGISAGAQTLIRAGKDLNEQVQKALKFDQVFKDLVKETDPLRSSLDELSTEMEKLKVIFGEAGASAADYAKLEELYAIKQAKAIFDAARPRRELEIQLMEAQGNAVGALAAKRALELEGMDANLRGLQQQIYAAEDATKATETLAEAQAKAAEEAAEIAEAAISLARDRRSLEIDLMEALGNSTDALTARRALELDGMDATLRGLQEQIYAAQDARAASEAAAEAAKVAADEQAKALEAAAKLTNDRRELEIQLMEAQGMAVEALAARRTIELEAMDASLRGLQEQIYAARAKAEADELAAKAAQETADAQAKAAEDATQAMQKYADTLASVSQTVVDEINRLRGINTASSSALLKAQFATLTAQARTGNLDALGKLPELSRSIEEATLGTATSALEVARIRAWLDASLSETLASQAASSGMVNATSSGLTFDGNSTASANAEQTSGELSNMSNVMYTALYQIAKNTGKSYELMDRWDGDGLPDIREDASDYY